MKKISLLAIVAMVGLSGCSSVHQGVASGALQTSVRADHVANIKVGEKISGESSAKILFGFFKVGGDNKFVDGMSYAGDSETFNEISPIPLPIPSFSKGMNDVKSAAAYNAMANSGADVIVAPTYKTTVKNDFLIYKELEARVDGYKGTITGFTQKN